MVTIFFNVINDPKTFNNHSINNYANSDEAERTYDEDFKIKQNEDVGATKENGLQDETGNDDNYNVKDEVFDGFKI